MLEVYPSYLRCLNEACRATRRITVADLTQLIAALHFVCPECGAVPEAGQDDGLCVYCTRCGWKQGLERALRTVWSFSGS
jgi:hypothetical protein